MFESSKALRESARLSILAVFSFNKDEEWTLEMLANDSKLIASRDEHGQSALHVLSRRARLGPKSRSARPLPVGRHAAAEAGSAACAELLLAAGSDPDAVSSAGFTPALRAAMHGATDVLAALARWGADLSGAEDDGRSPLGMACERGHARAAALLRTLAERRSLDGSAGPGTQDPSPGRL